MGFNEQFEKEKQRTGLHSYDRLDDVYSQISQKCLDVYQMAQDLNSYKNPSLIKKINNEFLIHGESFRNKVSREITDNENFKVNIAYHSNDLREIENNLRRLISTSFSYPITEKLRNHSRTPLKQRQSDVETKVRNSNVMGEYLKTQHQQLKLQNGSLHHNPHQRMSLLSPSKSFK